MLVPIYDARQHPFDYAADLDNIATVLPSFNGEILGGSFVVVAYTMSTFKKGGNWHLNTNVQFVLLVKDVGMAKPFRVPEWCMCTIPLLVRMRVCVYFLLCSYFLVGLTSFFLLLSVSLAICAHYASCNSLVPFYHLCVYSFCFYLSVDLRLHVYKL